MDQLRYPIGKFAFDAASAPLHHVEWITQIAEAPARLRAAVAQLTPEQLETAYRPGGWTVRQVVHHVADSHLNSYARFRLALTEEEPVVKPYHEDRWAELPDARTAPVEISLALLDPLHERWVHLLRSFGPAEFARRFRHPELGEVNLERYTALYAWHGRHHVAHVTSLRDRLGWK